jgi:phage gp45-like
VESLAEYGYVARVEESSVVVVVVVGSRRNNVDGPSR